jgi:cellulose synthase/poly-beta-1,6-N-acetylglucosamine synthase-like glycosyltransferase
MSEGDLRFSVGVSAYNEEKSIGRLMAFLLAQELEDIFVYNDGSTDHTKEILARFDGVGGVRVMNAETNRGISYGISKVIENTRNPILVMLDADTMPREGAIQMLAECFRDQNVGGACGGHRMIHGDKWSIINCINERIYEAKKNIDVIQSLRDEYMHLNGLIIAFRKSILPSKLTKHTSQDAYLGWYIRSNGYRNVFVPEAWSTFQPPNTVRDYIRGRNRVIRNRYFLSIEFKTPGYVWRDCRFSKYVYELLAAAPLWSFRGLLSLIFGIAVDVYYRLYWFNAFRHGKENDYRWEQVTSTKW